MKIVREKNAVNYILSGELDNYHIQEIKELLGDTNEDTRRIKKKSTK